MARRIPLTPEQVAEQAATFASVLDRIDRGDDDLAVATLAPTNLGVRGTDALLRLAERSLLGSLDDWMATLAEYIA